MYGILQLRLRSCTFLYCTYADNLPACTAPTRTTYQLLILRVIQQVIETPQSARALGNQNRVLPFMCPPPLTSRRDRLILSLVDCGWLECIVGVRMGSLGRLCLVSWMGGGRSRENIPVLWFHCKTTMWAQPGYLSSFISVICTHFSSALHDFEGFAWRWLPAPCDCTVCSRLGISYALHPCRTIDSLCSEVWVGPLCNYLWTLLGCITMLHSAGHHSEWLFMVVIKLAVFQWQRINFWG